MYIRDLNFEVEKLESTEGVDSCHVATAPLHKDWLDIKSVDVNVIQKSLSNVFSSKEKLETKKALKARVAAMEALAAFEKYYVQGKPSLRKSDHQTDLIPICQI